jgi:signal transduction histidine kinase
MLGRLFALTACLSFALCAAEVSAEDLARESEAKCDATAAQKPAPQLIVQQVQAAAALVAKDGVTSFAKFKGKDSAFIFGGTYIWIHDMNGKMRMHPVKPKMEGKDLLNLRDSNGKTIFVEMNKVAAAGGGWVEYVWPKPGAKESSPKVSYVVQAKHGDEVLVVGCGVYDMTLNDVKTSLAK